MRPARSVERDKETDLGSALRNPKMWTLVRKEKVRKFQKEQLVQGEKKEGRQKRRVFAKQETK